MSNQVLIPASRFETGLQLVKAVAPFEYNRPILKNALLTLSNGKLMMGAANGFHLIQYTIPVNWVSEEEHEWAVPIYVLEEVSRNANVDLSDFALTIGENDISMGVIASIKGVEHYPDLYSVIPDESGYTAAMMDAVCFSAALRMWEYTSLSSKRYAWLVIGKRRVRVESRDRGDELRVTLGAEITGPPVAHPVDLDLISPIMKLIAAVREDVTLRMSRAEREPITIRSENLVYCIMPVHSSMPYFKKDR